MYHNINKCRWLLNNCILLFTTKIKPMLQSPQFPMKMPCTCFILLRIRRNMTYLPPLFYYNDFLSGMILKRVVSKKIFKKWNRCVFVIKPSFLQLYRTVMEWKQQGPIYWQTNIHSYMVNTFLHHQWQVALLSNHQKSLW